MNIHRQMIAAGVECAHHESDLYARITPASEAIVRAYQFPSNVTRFSADDGSGRWFDIPFAYDPTARMTTERLRAIVKAGAAYMNYSRHMTADEIAEVNAVWDANPRGDSSFGSTLRAMAGLTAWPPYAEESE